MREDELRKHAICSICGKKIGHTGLPIFWTVRIERHGVDLAAVGRQGGLTAFLGGRADLARIMGPNEEMTVSLMDPVELTLCEECAMGDLPIAALAEYGPKDEHDAGEGIKILPLNPDEEGH